MIEFMNILRLEETSMVSEFYILEQSLKQHHWFEVGEPDETGRMCVCACVIDIEWLPLGRVFTNDKLHSFLPWLG